MKKILIPATIILIGFNTSFAGSAGAPVEGKSHTESRGDKYYRIYAFNKAIDYYTHAKSLSTGGQRKLAESYRNTGQNTLSEAAYYQLITMPEGVLPEDYYNYAMILKINGKYNLSNKWMDKFSELKPNDLRAKDYVANKDRLTDLLKDEDKYKIAHLNINTDAEDFGTSFYKNKIVFSSTRSGTPKLIQRKYNWNRKPFLDLYVSEVESGQLNSPKNFDKSINGKWHDGPASFSNNGTYMATTCNYHDVKHKDSIVGLQICFSSYKDGEWGKHTPFFLNSKGYSVGQPCLTADGNTMYFISDMPGGYGGADIYRITKDDKGQWGKPENLGDKINTEGDEMFPFFDEKNKVLFFTSNGHFGLGGLDIFICALNDTGTYRVYNAGFPLNTQFDDFALIVDDKMEKGYFSSNRTGGSGDDDIYAVDLLKGLDIGRKIEGIAKDGEGNHLPETRVVLFDDKDNVIDTVTTKDDGAYTFLVEPNKKFRLTGKKENYTDGENVANTFGKELIVRADLTLLKKEVKTQDSGKIVELNPDKIYFDLNKFNIRPDAQIALEKIAKIMNSYPEMVVELSSHTDCRASKEYNQRLSEKRAKASAEYIKKRITKPERIYGKGYGETRLVNQCACEGEVVSDCTEEEHQLNRRTEFTIVRTSDYNKLSYVYINKHLQK